MKHLSLICLLFVLSGFVYAQEGERMPDPSEVNVPMFDWLSRTHDFGQIVQNKPVTARYEFSNMGKTDLVIEEVKRTCGCTMVNWTKDPIPPGGSGFVEATYNAKKEGVFNKGITVKSNAKKDVTVLYLKGEVVTEEKIDLNDKNMMAAPGN